MRPHACFVAAAYCVILSAQYSHRDGAERRWQRGQLLPGIRGRVVHSHVHCCRLVLLNESTDTIYFPVQSDCPDMVQTPRHGSTAAPSICRGIVFLVQRLVDESVGIASQDIDPPARFRHPYFTARMRQRSLIMPAPLPL